jgi:serine/threonine-protein phosphatase 6 catalytic subunit
MAEVDKWIAQLKSCKYLE